MTTQPCDTSTPVVVLTTTAEPLLHSPLAVARSLGRLGVSVYTAHPGRALPYDRSCFVIGRFEVAHDPADPERLMMDLVQAADDVGPTALLIPVDDTAALYVDDHADLLAERYVFPRRPPGLAASLADKASLHGLCSRLGVATPRAVVPTNAAQVVEYADAAGFPVVAKVIDLGRLRNGVPSVTLARDAEELLAVYEDASRDGMPNLLLQEYLPGGSDTVWMFNGYFDARSRCLAAFTGTKLRQCPPGTGPTSLGICRANPDVERQTIGLLSHLGYTGIVDLGYRYDSRDGRYKLLDVNPRIGGTFRLFVDRNGVDVARALYLDLTGQQVPASRTPEGRRWLDEPHDLYAVLRAAGRGLRPVPWVRSVAGVEETAWLAADDPVPFAAMTGAATKSAVGLFRRRGRSRPVLGSGQRRIDRYFNEQASFWDDMYDGRHDIVATVNRRRQERALDWVDHLHLPDTSCVLEVGCGAGHLTAELAARGQRVSAIDAARAMVEKARHNLVETRYVRNAVVELGDVHQLSFDDDSFDLVVALGVTPWLHTPRTALKEMARVLRPGGHLLVSIDNRGRMQSRLDPLGNPALQGVRQNARATLVRLGVMRPRKDGHVRARFHRVGEFNQLIEELGLARVDSACVGFGPFTFLRREFLPAPAGARLDRALQRLADLGTPGLRFAGSQYLVLARQPVLSAPGTLGTVPDRSSQGGHGMNDDVTVLYIAGSSRTGSTILANTLGQLDGHFVVGELWNIWRRGLVEGRRCGCGQPVLSCPVWSAVLRQAFGRPVDTAEAARLDALTRDRLRHWARAITHARRAGPLDGDEYRGALGALYQAVREVTGCRVIVDSSKSPVYASLLATVPGVRLHVVHLVRDARAAAFSNRRFRVMPDFGDRRLMPREGPAVTARRWAKNHALCEVLLPGHVDSFTRLRYEDFVERPVPTLERIMASTGEPAALPFTGERTVRLAATHSVSGNPGRFDVGEVTLRLDDEWRHAMSLSDRAVVTTLTWPLLLRHRYILDSNLRETAAHAH
ncbi:MAG: methyltransferase domain-containing protein [Nocardioides sp.]|nr:methyltransferase domain-containing protein [Nocardioides sp.]